MMSSPGRGRVMERRAVLFAALLSALSWRAARTDEPAFQQPAVRVPIYFVDQEASP